MERPVVFDCAGENLIGIVSTPDRLTEIGVLIVVGGPQYRIGSHRQFVLLARHLAQNGIAAMRFDYRGMGDSSGRAIGFEDTVPDIAAAINAFKEACPSLRKIVMWGLCDAASAALLYVDATGGQNVDGLVLVNPWIRTEETHARARLKHYYPGRLTSPAFWGRIVRGRVDIAGSAREVWGALAVTIRRPRSDATAADKPVQVRVARALGAFPKPMLLLLSERDLTAKEFMDVFDKPLLRKLEGTGRVTRVSVRDADHTFSSREARDRVERLTCEWLRSAGFALYRRNRDA